MAKASPKSIATEEVAKIFGNIPGVTVTSVNGKAVEETAPIIIQAPMDRTEIKVDLKDNDELFLLTSTARDIVNSDAAAVDDYDNFPINLTLGCETIGDFLTIMQSKELEISSTVSFVHSSFSGLGCLISLHTKLYADRCNGSNLPLQELADCLVINEGFVKIKSNAMEYTFAKFTENLLPYMYVSIGRHGFSTEQGMVSGLVDAELYGKISALLLPHMPEKPKRVTLKHLKAFIQVRESTFPDFKEESLNEKMDYAIPQFYPWFKEDLKKYFTDYLNSNANVLVLIGPPGTGKSTLIRTMLRDLDLKALLAYKPEVITHPMFIDTCQEFLQEKSYTRSREFGSRMEVSTHQKVVVVEDGDAIMKRRTDGNARMAEILNATSGITSDKSKLILSTNLNSHTEIDPALIRPGRCFDILCFRPLTATEASIARKMRGLTPREYDPKLTYKLAEILNDAVNKDQIEPIVQPRFGFLNS